MQKNIPLSERYQTEYRCQRQKCFENAQDVCEDLQKKGHTAVYVEGFAITPVDSEPIEHGWIELNGEIIDVTEPKAVIEYFPGLFFPDLQKALEIPFLQTVSLQEQLMLAAFFHRYGRNGIKSEAFMEAKRKATERFASLKLTHGGQAGRLEAASKHEHRQSSQGQAASCVAVNQIVLIVGPSGVGKTAASQAVKPAFPDLVFDDFDDLAARWAHSKGLIDQADVHLLRQTIGNDDLFLVRGLEAIDDLSERNRDRSIVIDVGAGFQDATPATLLYKRHPCITITAAPEVAFKRIREKRNDPRTLQGYIKEEFNQHRTSVYDASQHRIETTNLTLEQTTQQLTDILRQILGPSAGSRPVGG